MDTRFINENNNSFLDIYFQNINNSDECASDSEPDSIIYFAGYLEKHCIYNFQCDHFKNILTNNKYIHINNYSNEILLKI